MDTITELPSLDTVPKPPRRRPWLRIVFALLLLAILGFGAWAAAFLSNYQPLAADGLMSSVAASASEIGSFTSPHGEVFTAYRLPYADGQRFGYGFTLVNHGSFPVTIERISVPWGGPEYEFPAEPTGVRIGKGIRPYSFYAKGGHGVPFEPFVLRPDEYRAIWMQNRFVHCSPGDGGMIIGNVDVTFRVFGITRHTTLSSGYTIETRGTGRCAFS